MKKIAVTICIFILFLILYFLQANFFTWFNIAGVKPNLFILLALTLGLFVGRGYATAMGCIMGLLLDVFIGRTLGVYSIMLGFMGYIGGQLEKKFSKDSKITIILMIGICTFLYEIGIYIINAAVLGIDLEIFAFLKINCIEIFYNIILTIILYPLIKRGGYYIQDIFRGNKILTRYF